MKHQKIQSVLAAVLFCASLLASCGESGTAPASDAETSAKENGAGETEAVTAEAEPAPEIEDMDGAELVIVNYTPTSFSWANTIILVDSTDGDSLNDALYNRQKKVEELYNCVITENNPDDVGGTISKSVMAGDHSFDTAMVFDANIADVLIKGLLASWGNLKELDLTKPWWDTAATEQYNFYGIQAAITGAYSLYNYSTRHCMLFNAKMMQELDIEDDLYDTVRRGQWTVDRLYELGALASADLDGDGTIDPKIDRFGITGTVTRYYSGLLTGADIRYIDRKPDGTLYYTLPGNEYAQSYISKLVHLDTGNNIFTSGTKDIGGSDETIFPSGRAMFFMTYVGDTVKIRDVDFDIGFLPPPKHDEAQESYYSLVEGGAQSILPATVTEDDYHRISVILNALSYYSYQESIPAYIEVLLKEKVARDEDSSEMLELIFNCSSYDLGTGVWSAEIKNKFTQNIFLPRKDEVSSLLAKTEPAVEKALAKFTESVKELED